MKKFSNVSKFKVNEEPKIDKKVDESEIIKYKMIDLMDKLLSIQTYGPIDKHQRAGLIKITGKEMLAEAISDMLLDIANSDKRKLLESLKSEIRDWDVIDNKIDSLSINKPSLNNKFKFKKILEKYIDEEELLVEVVTNKVIKINNIDTLEDYINITKDNSKLTNESKLNLINIYNNRIKQIESLQ